MVPILVKCMQSQQTQIESIETGILDLKTIIADPPVYLPGDSEETSASATQENITELQSQIDSLKGSLNAILDNLLNPFQTPETSESTESKSFEDLTVNTLTVNEILTAFGGLQVPLKSLLSDTVITGTLQVGFLNFNDLDASINSLVEPLKIQNNPLIGTGTIKAGETESKIATTKITANSKVFVTAITKSGGQGLYVTEIREGELFVVRVEKPFESEINFNWWAIN